jgi:hypothetical protein
MAVLPTGIGPVTGGYNIERSLRFNSADSAYLNRTFSTPTSQNVWSFSAWVKRSKLGSNQFIFWAGTTSTNDCALYFSSSDQIGWFTNNGSSVLTTSTAVFRDPSAWYHVVAIANSTTMNVYVNNQQVITSAGMTNNTINSAIAHNIGRDAQTSGNEFSGYMTEVNFIDGQALTPSSFGETDTNTGVWKPKAYSGTYGTNGFELNFSDNSNTTAATLGKDSSGNSNNWTPNNFSVTAGVGNDSLVDSPTAYGTDTGAGGSVRGNYATVSPIGYRTTTPTPTITNGNLDVVCPSGSASSIGTATFGVSSGKWYWEATKTGTAYGNLGVVLTPFNMAASSSLDLGGLSNEYVYVNSGSKFNNNSSSAYGASWTNNDVIGVALDLDAGTLVFYKNGSSQGTAFSSLPSGIYLVGGYDSFNGSGFVFNFGQRPFAYTAPSGFKALVTTNLPTPTIGATSTTQANDYFDVTTYSGSASSQSITNSGSMQPDFVWIKSRNTTDSHNLTDAVRGTNKNLFSNLTDAEDTVARLTSFNSNGVTLAGGYGSTNNSGQTYVAWQWNAGGSNATNTAGTITSTVRANTTSGFSIVTWTANGSSPQTIGHGLGVAPSMIITKQRNGVDNWFTYHASLGATKNVRIDETAAAQTQTGTWNNTAPTSTVFSTGNFAAFTTNGNTLVAYCFAPVAGYSAFGSYTGNGSADGPFVYTGFRPRWVMVKESDTSARDWIILDTARNTYNVADLQLMPNKSDAEATTVLSSTAYLDILSNGFKVRNTSVRNNENTATYIYAAFAEAPFKYSLAR